MGLFDGTALERPVVCERCQLDIKVCVCPPPEIPPDKQRLTLRLEKRNKGKWVTCIRGFTGSQEQRQRVLVELKNACGAGGTVQDEGVELQGDHLQRAKELLKRLGYRV
jgi:translation initiation factor 1